ncbi:glycosyltransferase family 4 protein [Geomonas anaerohicana]|uniref:Glycosyltransferase n=1 Tax=Geomonas anaerohicana TaxID=2798583 RepID=A0ABS0YGY7_9BACT|nr:glycosyltransferase family 4 protein [Geomonas anaerohicana]MBJ6751584.1 glycosyltransferase [Geomonas anaerohicana]
MKILIIAPFLPYPLDQGGKIRVFNIIKNLIARHSVTLAVTVDDRRAVELGPLQHMCSEVLLFERPAQLWPDRARFFTSTAPYNVIRYRCAEMRNALRQLHQNKRFDVVQIEFAMMWPYADLFPDTPVVLDAHNIEHDNVRQIGQSAKTLPWKILYEIERRRLQAVEEQAWRECQLCFAVSDQEREKIAASVGRGDKVITAPNGVDPERFKFRKRLKSGKRILFLGGMDYAPNLDAARYFLAEVLPLIRAEDSEVSVMLVGRELSRLGPLAELPGVQCHESVPEVLPWFYEADLLAVSLRQGAGTRIKVLEAMAAGLPVVSTTKGCEGISARNGQELLVADTPMALAKAMVEVIRSPDVAQTLAQKAHQMVINGYTWESATRKMEEAYRVLGNHD